ncbi:MAG: hypothetical protein DME23_27085, partial [Verrucomicrobia bacterium]
MHAWPLDGWPILFGSFITCLYHQKQHPPPSDSGYGSFPQAVIPGSPARKRDLIMARRTKSGKQAADMLERLDSEEAVALLHLLLDKHPELRPEVEEMAKNVISSKSIEDIAADVFSAVTEVDLEALHGRAGKHSWGYVEPSEAAWELLEEALDDWI